MAGGDDFMAKLTCDICGYTRDVPEAGEMVEQPTHCGQAMKVED